MAYTVEQLLGYLASPDPHLRDEVGYGVLGTWIARDVLGDSDLGPILEHCLAGLQHGLGETETDSVFLRTFSALILAELVRRDARRPFLPEGEIHRILDTALRYLGAEQDLRGFVPGKGWAHAGAHCADLLGQLAAHPIVGTDGLERMLSAITQKVGTPTPYAFAAQEEYRLTVAVRAALKRGLLSSDWVAGWLRDLAVAPTYQEHLLARDHNLVAFVGSLVLMLSSPEPQHPSLLEEARATLKTLLPWF